MDNNKTKGGSTSPSSLHHYTSLGTVAALFDRAINQSNDLPRTFVFRASNALCMNDKMEGKLIADKFFTSSEIKKHYQSQLEKIVKEKGEIYVISFCRSNNKTKYNGYIPMWGMYGDKGNGAILVFDFDKLQDYISQLKDVELYECEYCNSTELAKLIKDQNTKANGTNDKTEFLSNLRNKAFKLKDKHWDYEDEWRILATSHDLKLKYNSKGVVSYNEIKIPVNCLNAIILGPLVDSGMCEKVLNTAISRLKEADNTISQDIKIKPSKLQIR